MKRISDRIKEFISVLIHALQIAAKHSSVLKKNLYFMALLNALKALQYNKMFKVIEQANWVLVSFLLAACRFVMDYFIHKALNHSEYFFWMVPTLYLGHIKILALLVIFNFLNLTETSIDHWINNREYSLRKESFLTSTLFKFRENFFKSNLIMLFSMHVPWFIENALFMLGLSPSTLMLTGLLIIYCLASGLLVQEIMLLVKAIEEALDTVCHGIFKILNNLFSGLHWLNHINRFFLNLLGWIFCKNFSWTKNENFQPARAVLLQGSIMLEAVEVTIGLPQFNLLDSPTTKNPDKNQ